MQSSTSRVWFVLALFSLSVLVSCDSGGGTPEPDEPSELGVDVAGTVTSAENDEPIGGASVEVLRSDNGNTLASATTDTTGSYEATFTIEEPDAPDQIRLELSAEGFVDKEVSTGFQPSVTEDVTLEAMSVEAAASGTVTDTDTGDPIEGASVTGTRPDGGEQLFEATTSSDGTYDVTFEVADEPDEVAIQADAQGFEAADTTVSFSEQISADLGLQVATTQAIASGTVTNEDTGDPIEGASITGTRPDGGEQLFQATTSSDGTYEASFEVADEPSEIEISANADGFEMASQTVTFSGDISVGFELPSATTQSTASGQVTREDNGDPIGGASVTGTRAGSGEKLFETTTASDGTYEATFGVTDEPSEVTIQADAENFESGEQTVNFGEQITADFSLQPATIEATASGTVSRSDSGDPIEGATVTGTRAGSGEQLFEATTSSDGSYEASYSVKATNEPSDIALSANATNFKSADKTVSFSEEITGDLQLEPKTTESTASGTVTRSDTGDPIEGATITGTRPDTGEQLFETTSSSDGSYQVSFEVEATDEPSDVTLSAGAADFNSETSTVNFSQEITTDFALEVATTEATASGTVSRSDSGDPIEGATVTGTRAGSGEQLFEATTSSDGSYEASYSVKATNEPSDVDFAVSAGDFTSGGATVAFAEEIARDFQLEPKTTEATVSGAVTRSDNSDPIDGVTVTGSPAGGSEKLFETTTNASGEYETTFEVKVPDEPDQISVTANSGDYDGSEKTVDFGSAITTDFALDPSEVNVTIDGTITAKLDGSTVEGAEVSAFRPNGSGALASTTSEMGGAYSLSFTVLAPDA
ncbi:lipopolysaccharide export system protein LptA, partial [Salinibacter ruber]|uniref:carboxypeptidase regulatory-like domain-containing protein n=1 Tax=Salinibacter ruber TaxID=146919 RepID=UPI0021698EAA